jgi:predicted secreted protein
MISEIIFGFAIYVVVWWLVLFAVLPIGVKSQSEHGGRIPRGSERGAPVKPLMLKKIAATSVIAALLLAIGYGLSYSGFIDNYILPPQYAADRTG